jgi:hypothetical protein
MTTPIEKYKEIQKDMIDKGYYVGTFEDFFNNITKISREEFKIHSDTFIESANYRDVAYVYRHNYLDQHTKTYLEKQGYTGPVPTEKDILDEIHITESQHRKDFINLLIEAGTGTRTTQQWGRLDLGAFDGVDEVFRRRVRNMENFFRNLTQRHAAGVYPELNPMTCSSAYQFSLYENGDFSEVHYDGVNPDRYCVIIAYFGDPNTYSKECGGELYIETTTKQVIEVKPVYGTYAMLDFRRYNLGHGIRAVGNNFKRFALQSFVGL